MSRARALPFLPGVVSNGEFLPAAPTSRDRAIAAEALVRAEVAADRLGMDRRRFLHTAGGVAAMLAAVNLLGCSGDGEGSAPPSSGRAGAPTTAASSTTATAGGAYRVPPPEETERCATVLGDGGEFIFDVHTHHVMPDGTWRQAAPLIVDMMRKLVPAGCTAADPIVCLDRTSYVRDMFLASDTAVAMLTDVPNSGPADAALPFDAASMTEDFVADLDSDGAPRLLIHEVIAPNFGPLGARLDDMSARAATGRVAAFKVYTAWGPGGHGFALDDPAIGFPVIEHARSLGVGVICAHKGLPLMQFDLAHNGPRDLVAAAARYPDMQFVVYHSAFQIDTPEGAYDAGRAATGINSLLKALDDYAVPPNANVWAELGSTWRELMSHPTAAAHALGKLLTRVGQDRVMWGTDAIWFGSPQPQIMAFRAFEITPAFQARYGYPALTAALKAKVFGLNAAALFGVDPGATRCAVQADSLAAARPEHDALVAAGALPSGWAPSGPLTRREVGAWLRSSLTHWTPW